MQTNNGWREALTQILNLTNSLDEDCAVDPVEIRDIAKAALSEPVKNYEVGTVEDQTKRKMEFCQKQGSCGNCSLNRGQSITPCVLAWAQMPYEEGGAK